MEWNKIRKRAGKVHVLYSEISILKSKVKLITGMHTYYEVVFIGDNDYVAGDEVTIEVARNAITEYYLGKIKEYEEEITEIFNPKE